MKNLDQMKNFIQSSYSDSAAAMNELAQSTPLLEATLKAIDLISISYQQGGRLFIAGNGGSAADAQHIAAELVGKLDKDRTPLAAFAMTVDSSYLTAVGNDYGYEHIFSRQVEGLMREKDIFLGITTSGNSVNILNALKVCKRQNIFSIILSGKGGGKIAQEQLADLMIVAPGKNTALIQQSHIAIYHTLCFGIEKSLIETGHISYR